MFRFLRFTSAIHLFGFLTRMGGGRTIFSFNDVRINKPNRPTVSLAFKGELDGLISDFNPYQAKLMPFLSNLLPEGYLREYLPKRAGMHKERKFVCYGYWDKIYRAAVLTVQAANGDE